MNFSCLPQSLHCLIFHRIHIFFLFFQHGFPLIIINIPHFPDSHQTYFFYIMINLSDIKRLRIEVDFFNIILDGTDVVRILKDLRQVVRASVSREYRFLFFVIGVVIKIDLLVCIVELNFGLGGFHDSNYKGYGQNDQYFCKSSSASLSSRTGKFHHLNHIHYYTTYLSLISFKYNYGFIKYLHMVKYLISILAIITIASAWDLNWGTYKWVAPSSTTIQPPKDNQVILSHPRMLISMKFSFVDQVKQVFNSYNATEYEVGEKGRFVIVSNGTEIMMKFDGIKGQISIDTQCQLNECPEKSQQFIKSSLQYIKQDKSLKRICTQKESDQNSFKAICTPLKKGSSTESLILHLGKPSQNNLTPENINNKKIGFLQKTVKLMKYYNVEQDSQGIHVKIFQNALTQLINSICLFYDDGIYYMGFCDSEGYNFKLAAYCIDFIGDFDASLGISIFQDFSTLLENKVLYPLDDQNLVFPIPQYIQVFTKYTHPSSPHRETDILNSLFVMPMLSQFGTLHEQLNYRQAKKLHPQLLRMLSQKWSSNSVLKAAHSFYQQSFTQDFKYHEYGDELEQSITKNSWIFKTLDIYTAILAQYYSKYMVKQEIQELMQQHFTLINIYKSYISQDQNAKSGKYLDIISTPAGQKFYSKNIGYGSILPFIYRAGSALPIQSLIQLSTENGIKSSNSEYDGSKRYRGNIHAYFNNRILKGLKSRLNTLTEIPQEKKKNVMGLLQNLGKGLSKIVYEQFKNEGKIYTSWTPEGKGIEEVSWLKIVSALLLEWRVQDE